MNTGVIQPPTQLLTALELQQKMDRWRQRAASGELTLDEMREAIILMRQGRVAAQEANAASGKSGGSRAKKQPIDTDKLLEGL